jgi:hypothetical protein
MEVGVIDVLGLISTGATNAVTLTVTSGPGTLIGTVTRNAVAGVVTFTGLSLTVSGNYVLTASSPGLTSVACPVQVTGSATHLSLSSGSGTGVGGGAGDKYVGVYWTNWASPRINTAPTTVNLFYLSFAVGDGTGTSGTVTFDSSGGGGIPSATMIADIAEVHTRGAKVLLSIGGAADGLIRIQNPTQVSQLVSSVISIVDTYGLDGIDWDLEETSVQTNVASLVSASQQLKTNYGPSFIVACAPIVGDTVYEGFALDSSGVCDLFGPQFYNDGLSDSARQANIVSYTTSMVGRGLAASRFMIGTTYAGAAFLPGQMDPILYLQAYQTLVSQGISVRGAFVWEMTIESNNNYIFASTFSTGMGGAPPTPGGSGYTGVAFTLTGTVLDAAGLVVGTSTASITLSKVSGPGTLSGTLIRNADGSTGSAHFTGLTVDADGDYVFEVTSPGLGLAQLSMSFTTFVPPAGGGANPWEANPNLFWNKRLPGVTPTNQYSVNYRNTFIAHLRAIGPYGVQNSMWPNTSGYTSPIYRAPVGTPRVTVDYGACWDSTVAPGGVRNVNVGEYATPYATLNAAGGVPIPSGAQVSPATDAEMAIHDEEFDTLYEFWMCLEPFQTAPTQVGPNPQTNPTARYQTCTAGVGPGLTTTFTGRFIDTPGYADSLWGAAATGLTYTGGRITPLDMTRGEIRHALDIAIPYNLHSNIANVPAFTWPAWRGDWGSLDISQGPPEGLRMRLPSTFDPNTLAQPFARLVAKCLVNYGAVINDTSGVISLRFDSTVGFTSQGQPDPWPTLFAGYGINYSESDFYLAQAHVREALATIPWEILEFLPEAYGEFGGLLFP